MSYDKRITDIAAQAALAAGKNASVAPQLLVADITFALADAVESGVISLAAIEATRPTAATDDVVKELVEAARALIERKSATFKARNGREVGIQGDDGEMCWVVHSDDMNCLETALARTGVTLNG